MNKTVEVMAMGMAPKGPTLSIHNARWAVKSRYSTRMPQNSQSHINTPVRKELKESDGFGKQKRTDKLTDLCFTNE